MTVDDPCNKWDLLATVNQVLHELEAILVVVTAVGEVRTTLRQLHLKLVALHPSDPTYADVVADVEQSLDALVTILRAHLHIARPPRPGA